MKETLIITVEPYSSFCLQKKPKKTDHLYSRKYKHQKIKYSRKRTICVYFGKYAESET